MAALTTLALLAGPSTAAAQCGQEYHATPTHSSTPGGPPLAIGDSVLADAVPQLVRYGFEADGMVCRQMSQGIAILQARQAHLPHLVVLALGTNGEVTPEEIDSALKIVGPRRILALVTPHGSVVPSSPAIIRSAAASHPGRILLLDWDRLVEGHPSWLASDGVHLGGSAGMDAFAQMIASLLTSAASAPSEPESPSEPTGPPVTVQPTIRHPTPPVHHHHKPVQPAEPASQTTTTTTSQPPARPVRAAAPASASNKFPWVGLAALIVVLIAAASAVWRYRVGR